MLSSELELRMTEIIKKIEEHEKKEKRPINKNLPLESEKCEYVIKKNARKRISQVSDDVTDFFNQDKDNKQKESSDISSISLNINKLITIGEFQIELQKLLGILEYSLKEEKKEEKYLEKYINDIFLVNDDNKMENDIKLIKFEETLEKKYHKISLLLKRYIKENIVVNELIEKEKKNSGMKNIIKGNRRRSLFDNNPLFCEKENKVIKGFPNFGNTFLSEMKEDIKKKKRNSCVYIGKEEEKICDSNNNSDNEDSNEDKEEDEINDDFTPVYRPGKLRSSLCFDELFVC